MQAQPAIIVAAINESPLNRGLIGEEWCADPSNIPIIAGSDVTLFDGEGAGVYQAHLLYKSRGRAAILRLKEAVAEMFAMHGAQLIFALVPDFRKDAAFVARSVGGKFVGKRNTLYGKCDLFVLSKEMWEGLPA